MDEILQKVFESEVFNDDTKKAITEAFNTAIAEAVENAQKEERAKLAERYESDKENIIKALETYMEQSLEEHVSEFQTGINEVNDMKAKLAKQLSEVKSQAKKQVKARLEAFQKVFSDKLEAHLTELHEDTVVNRKAYLKAINESKASFEAEKEKLRKGTAKFLEHTIEHSLKNLLEAYVDDINQAKKANFGMEIYEAFYNTFRTQYINTDKETKALADKVNKLEETLKHVKSSSRKAIAEATRKAETALKAKKLVEEKAYRKDKINGLLENLKGDTRDHMRYLLESTSTERLDSTYKKELPRLLKERHEKVGKAKTAKKIIKENDLTFVSGSPEISEAPDDEIVEIRRRAGIR